MKVHLIIALVALAIGFAAGRRWNLEPADAAAEAARAASLEAAGGSVSARTGGSAAAGGRESTGPQPAEVNPVAGLDSRLHAVFLTGNPISRTLRFAELLQSMTPENAVDFRAIFFEFDKQGLTFDAEWRLIWHQWAKVDPAAALRALEEENSNGRKASYAPSITEVIFSSWGESDSAAANAGLADIKDPELYNRGYLGILRGMDLASASDFAAATDFPDSAMASAAAERLAERSFRESGSTVEMKSWFAALDDGPLKDGAIDHVYWRLRQADLGDASQWVSERAAVGTDTRRINGELAVAHAAADPLKGLDWYLSLPADTQDADALGRLLAAAEKDSDAFQQWQSTSAVAGKIAKAESRLGTGR